MLECIRYLGNRERIAEQLETNTKQIFDKFVDVTVLELIDREYGSLDENEMPATIFDEEKLVNEAKELFVEEEDIQNTLLFLETRSQGKIIATTKDGQKAIDVVEYKKFRSKYPTKMAVDQDVNPEVGNVLKKGTIK